MVRASLPLAVLVAALLAPAAGHAAAVEFYAVADKTELGLDDTLTVTVTLSVDASGGEEEELRLPEAPDFQVLSRSQSQRMSFAMGQAGPPTFRKVRTYTLLLEPRRTGTLTIGAGRLIFRGRTYETGAIRVKVVNAGRAPRPRSRAGTPSPPFAGFPGGGSLPDDADSLFDQFFGGNLGERPTSDTDLYVRNVVDKKKAFLGEQVTLSTYLFSRVDISGVDGFKMPRLDGFWAEDLETPTQISGETRNVGGVLYRVFLLRKRALFPIRTGKLTVDPVEVDISTGFGFFSGRKVHRASQPVTIEAEPLPPGAPAGFEGSNVGSWRLSAEASPSTVPLGQPITVKITLEGVGNLTNVAIPKLPTLKGFKAYDPTVTQKTAISRSRYGGSRVAEYLLMPEQTGSFELPALRFEFFNPQTRAYETATTDPIALRVEPGSAQAAAPGALPGANGEKTGGNVIGADGLRPLRYKGELPRPRLPLYRQPFFLPAAVGPLLLWLCLGLVGLVRTSLAKGDPATVRRQVARRTRKRLKKAEALLAANAADPFYAEVQRALNEYLSHKLEVAVAGLTRPELCARLAAAGLPEAAVARLAGVLDTCDAGRFAPGATEHASMANTLAEALAAMQELESTPLKSAAEVKS